mmetsp:Transcript_1738/g.2718  ORF Transcript_1738/g.2718 Transcript_1738/m.2718 type:complete len:182 (+) Transcript_1738:78-623(+)
MQMDSESSGFVDSLSRKWQYILDKSSPQITLRWSIMAAFTCMYVLRVYLINGWYIVTYGLGIYLLNQLIGFLSPQFDPEVGDGDMSLPTREGDEFRPFARRLPEFKFWYSCTRAVALAFFMTFFEVFDVPVFWPILLLYFIVLFFLTMKRQIKHMIKHKYVPWSWGKQKYNTKNSVNHAKK